MAYIMLSVRNAGIETNEREVFRNVSFSVNKGDKIGLVGKNGIGKTTLLQLLSGDLQPTSGEVLRGDYEVGLLPQDLKGWVDKSVYEFVETITGVADARIDFDASCRQLEHTTDDATLLLYADSLEKFNRYEVANFDNNLEKALALAEIDGIDVNSPLGSFSGGQKTRIALAAVFASKHDVVLLDEPTNNLDSRGIIVLEKFIGNSNAAFVMVSHDRRFLRNATTRIIELLGGDKGVKQYGLGYDEYLESRVSEHEAIAKRHEQYERDVKRIKKAAREANIRAAESGNTKAKSDNDKLGGNFKGEKASKGLARAANSLTTRLGHIEEPERPVEEVSLSFLFKEVDDKKVNLLSVRDLEIAYDSGFKAGPLSLNIRSGDKISINGSNGVGKSSLLRAIIEKSGDGTVSGSSQLGKEAVVMYVDQDQSLPLMDRSAFDNLKHLAPQLETHDAINLLLRFNLNKASIQSTQASLLSGGERAKVILAAVAANQANLLVMDEPTNNLDIPTIEALENALRSYNGGLLIVSHDRDFLASIGITQEVHLR